MIITVIFCSTRFYLCSLGSLFATGNGWFQCRTQCVGNVKCVAVRLVAFDDFSAVAWFLIYHVSSGCGRVQEHWGSGNIAWVSRAESNENNRLFCQSLTRNNKNGKSFWCALAAIASQRMPFVMEMPCDNYAQINRNENWRHKETNANWQRCRRSIAWSKIIEIIKCSHVHWN